jgi:hypothetical protein
MRFEERAHSPRLLRVEGAAPASVGVELPDESAARDELCIVRGTSRVERGFGGYESAAKAQPQLPVSACLSAYPEPNPQKDSPNFRD